jgi:hypothetical protein
MSKEEDNIERLHIHIAGLEATLKRRKETILKLELEIKNLKINPITDADYKKAYRNGWQACASHLMEVTRKTAVDLGKVSRDAWKLYLNAEKNDE